MLFSFFYLYLAIKEGDRVMGVGIKGRKRSGHTVGKMPECISQLHFSHIHSTVEERWRDTGRRARGRKRKRVLSKAVKGTDKEISFVILSGRGKKKERDSDLKMFSNPIIRGEKGKERAAERQRGI